MRWNSVRASPAAFCLPPTSVDLGAAVRLSFTRRSISRFLAIRSATLSAVVISLYVLLMLAKRGRLSSFLVCGGSNRSKRVRRDSPFLLPNSGRDAWSHKLGHADDVPHKSAELWRIVRHMARGLNFGVKRRLPRAPGWQVIFRRAYCWAAVCRQAMSSIFPVTEFQRRTPAHSVALET